MGEQFEAAKNLCTDEAKKENTLKSGKGDLQWERDIPEASLANLTKLAADDFKGNLGKIVHDLYHTAHVMFSDMPQGDHKKRAKYRFASKNLMKLLPAEMKKEVEKLIERQDISLDLYDVLGFCTWGKDKVKEIARRPPTPPPEEKKEEKKEEAPKEEKKEEEAPKAD